MTMRWILNSRRPGRWLCAVTVAASLGSGCRLSHMVFNGGSLNAMAHRAESEEITGNVKSIEVENDCGAVSVTAVEDASYRWKWDLTVRSETDAEARDSLSIPVLRAETNGDVLRLTVKLPGFNRRRQFASDFELRVPKTVAVRARSHFGPVEIAGVDGPVTARSESGSVDVRQVSGRVDAQTSFSSLRVDNVGPATLRNQSGEVEAAHVHGDADVETSFGRLEATDIGGDLKARNQSGSIEARRVAGKADLKTSFSSLTAEDIDGPLTARNQSGSLTAKGIKGNGELETSFSALEASDISGDARLRNQSGQISVRNVTGAVSAETSFSAMHIEGSGESFVCRNQSGEISVRARSPNLTRLEAKTSFSAIDIELPSSVSRSISAHTTFGDVQSDFPVTIKSGGGVGEIALEDQSGSIHIHRIAE